jgi:hypothetical protein
VPRSSRRTGGFLCATLALAVALALSAPLVHAHLEAAGAASQGLCGEHHSESAPLPGPDACSLCLAGAHAPALREPSAPLWELSAAPASEEASAPQVDLSIARGQPGTPRAPPFPV